MAKAQAGDGAAYQTLLTEILPAIRAFCARRASYLGDPEDIAQEALLAIHKVRHTYDPKRKFCPWMYAVVRHKLIDHLRSKSRVRKNEMVNYEILERAAGQDLDGVAAPDHPQSDILFDAVNSLKDNYKQVIQLTKIDGLSTKEAAQKLGISESALKVRAHRAFEMLRKRLERKLHEK